MSENGEKRDGRLADFLPMEKIMIADDRKAAWYSAFKAKDARFDGRFFVAVSSTGIYCRPVCTAKLPKFENCSFHRTAASAEHAGYRPCLLCRPELAPGNAPIDASASLARRAARLLEDNCGSDLTLEDLAEPARLHRPAPAPRIRRGIRASRRFNTSRHAGYCWPRIC